MARKKSRRITIKKKKIQPITNKFDCPKCNHEKVVSCKINRSQNVGEAICSVCESNYRCTVTKLDGFIDVYHNWVDEMS